MTKRLLATAAIAAAFGCTALAQPAGAASYLLDFGPGSCGETACSNGSYFSQSYGDAPGVDVTTAAYSSDPDNELAVPLAYWSTGYGDLLGVAWSGPYPGVGEITFAATGSDGITLHSLQTAGWAGWDYETEFRVYDVGGGLLFSTGAIAAPATGHLDVALEVSSAHGLILRWDNAWGAAIDNLSFSVGPLAPPPPAVPEPASWALLIGGFALAGGALRRRSVAAHIRFA